MSNYAIVIIVFGIIGYFVVNVLITAIFGNRDAGPPDWDEE